MPHDRAPVTGAQVVGGRLVHAASGVSLAVPHGWEVVEDVGAATCEAPAARADVTGRAVPARISIEMLERPGLLPHRAVDVIVRDLVGDALADHPHAWVLDCAQWRDVGTRVDVAQHDMSTPLVVSTVLLPGVEGTVRVTASVPVAHQRAREPEIEAALDSVRLGPAEVSAGPTTAPPLPYVAPTTRLSRQALDVFATGSHKIAARWRPEPFAAGLVDARGVATPLGSFVRRALSRPDLRATLTVLPIEMVHQAGHPQDLAAYPYLVVDRLDGYAVLRASAPARASGQVEGHPVSLEVVDLAAAPARAAAWLGLGPGRPADLPAGTLAVLGSAWSRAPGVRAEHTATIVSALPGPREVWSRLLDAMG